MSKQPKGFTRKQHARYYRPQIDRAWFAHCRRNNLDVGNDTAQDLWYRKELVAALGVYTTKQCDRKKDFETLMAHFEAIEGCSIQWQMKLASGDHRRLLHLVRARAQALGVTEEYIQGIADQMGFAELADLYVEQLTKLLYAIDKQVRRSAA